MKNGKNEKSIKMKTKKLKKKLKKRTFQDFK